MRKSYLYNEIADNIADKIKSGVLKAGEKLPSVRNLSREHGISINTAKRIFLELEARSLIWSKPQLGYFISSLSYLKLPLAEVRSGINYSCAAEFAQVMGLINAGDRPWGAVGMSVSGDRSVA